MMMMMMMKMIIIIIIIIIIISSSSSSSSSICTTYHMSWDSAVGIATAYVLEGREVGVRVSVGRRFDTSNCRPDRVWGLSSLLSNGYRGIYPRSVKLTTHVHLVPKSRKCGSIHSLPHTSS
jgi:hypothetical protein